LAKCDVQDRAIRRQPARQAGGRHTTAMLDILAIAAVSATPRPNLVIILVDDSGFNDVGFTNEAATGRPAAWHIRTPRIDALAHAGVRLSNYYVQPICTPTRAALLTGRYPFRYGVTGYTISADAPWGIPTNETFLPEFLRDAGYVTGIFGKCVRSPIALAHPHH
jgi:arylsulfatase A-like enzyme